MQTLPRRTFEEADADANLQHPDSWSRITCHRLGTQAVAGEILAELAGTRSEIAVVTADLKYSNRLSDFAVRHPDKCYQVGIAEQNMISVAVGIGCRFKRRGVPDEYVPVGPPPALYAHHRLDGSGIAGVAREFLDHQHDEFCPILSPFRLLDALVNV